MSQDGVLKNLVTSAVGFFMRKTSDTSDFMKDFLDFIHTGEMPELGVSQAYFDDLDKLIVNSAKRLPENTIGGELHKMRLRHNDELNQDIKNLFKGLKVKGSTIAERKETFIKKAEDLLKNLENHQNQEKELLTNSTLTQGGDTQKRLNDALTESHQLQKEYMQKMLTENLKKFEQRENYNDSIDYYQKLFILLNQKESVLEKAWQEKIKREGMPNSKLSTGISHRYTILQDLKLSDLLKFDSALGTVITNGKNAIFNIPQNVSSSYIKNNLDALSIQLARLEAPVGCEHHNKTLELSITLPPSGRQVPPGPYIKLLKAQVKHAYLRHGYDPNNIKCTIDGRPQDQMIKELFQGEQGRALEKEAEAIQQEVAKYESTYKP